MDGYRLNKKMSRQHKALIFFTAVMSACMLIIILAILGVRL